MKAAKPSAIGLIAGDKELPFTLLKWARANKVRIEVVGIEGCADKRLKRETPKGSYSELHISQL
ncbi:MAG: hypothetical protein LBO78_04040, partial [Rickettsiales bacterium]|nr:hypothetical protein [Rickettsiales bacterium]